MKLLFPEQQRLQGGLACVALNGYGSCCTTTLAEMLLYIWFREAESLPQHVAVMPLTCRPLLLVPLHCSGGPSRAVVPSCAHLASSNSSSSQGLLQEKVALLLLVLLLLVQWALLMVRWRAVGSTSQPWYLAQN